MLNVHLPSTNAKRTIWIWCTVIRVDQMHRQNYHQTHIGHCPLAFRNVLCIQEQQAPEKQMTVTLF